MQDPEIASLKRAVVALLVVSLARWGVGRGVPVPPGSDDSVLPGLLEASRIGAEEENQRAVPLAEGERLDPNRASAIELDRLPGVGPATAAAIVSARGGHRIFARPEDLLVVRGIGPALLSKITTHLDFGDSLSASRRRGATGGRDRNERVDVNTAGVVELATLPGIGPALAERIVAERLKQMFTSVEDLVRVPGIGPVSAERLRAHVGFGLRR